MNPSYTAIEHELRNILQGDCFFDERTRLQYSTASCWYKIVPVAVVFPKNTEDVRNTVRFCHEKEIPVIPRGAGTGLAGQAVGFGVILDFTKYMNNIGRIEAPFVHVQPGIVLDQLNNALRPRRQFFPVDPASGSLCTLGGMIATNASGGHGVKYGSTKDHVEELTVVLSNGEVATIARPKGGVRNGSGDMLSHIVETLEPLLQANKELIAQSFPNVAKNSCGYNLLDAVRSDSVDLRKIVVGSEGTLAVVIEAKLATMEIPDYRIGIVSFFKTYEETAEATIRGLKHNPAAVEILDHTYLSIARGEDESGLLRDDDATMLYFEFEGRSPLELEEVADALKRSVRECRPLDFKILRSDEELQKLWTLRQTISRELNFEKTFGKTSFVEDVAVPIPQLPAYIRGLSEILSRYGIRFSVYGHAGSGNIHCGTFVNLNNLDHYRNIDAIASEVNMLAISLGGTLSGEHGDGFIRTPFLERLYGAEVYDLFREVKNSFDPRNILNPGKIIGQQNTSILHDIDFA